MYDTIIWILITLACFCLGVALIAVIQVILVFYWIMKESRATISSPTSEKNSQQRISNDLDQQDLKPKTNANKFNMKMDVPELDPTAIAPSLIKPPKAAGDFGTKTDQK